MLFSPATVKLFASAFFRSLRLVFFGPYFPRASGGVAVLQMAWHGEFFWKFFQKNVFGAAKPILKNFANFIVMIVIDVIFVLKFRRISNDDDMTIKTVDCH